MKEGQRGRVVEGGPHPPCFEVQAELNWMKWMDLEIVEGEAESVWCSFEDVTAAGDYEMSKSPPPALLNNCPLHSGKTYKHM